MSRWWQYLSAIFANRLKKERESNGWTQEQFAELLGVSNGTVSGYERNYREPDFDTLIKIAKQLNVSIDYLLGYSDIRNPYIKTAGSPDESNELAARIAQLIIYSKKIMTKKEENFILTVIKKYIETLEDDKE